MNQTVQPTMEQSKAAPASGRPGQLFAKYGRLLVLGVLSVTLYFLLYRYNGDIKGLAQVTNAGDKSLFFIPIIVALVFSFIHGAFTSQFWDALGVKAKKS